MSGCIVPLAGYGPQRGARLLWVTSEVPTSAREPLGLLPQPQDCLGAVIQGRGYSGPQRKPETHQDEVH